MQVGGTSLGAKVGSPAISPVPLTPLKGNTIKIVKGKLGGIEQPESTTEKSPEKNEPKSDIGEYKLLLMQFRMQTFCDIL